MTSNNGNGNTGNTGNQSTTPSVRDQIASHLQSTWSHATPIIWENMPPQTPLPQDGWLRFRLAHGRTVSPSISGASQFRRGSVHLEVAVASGNGTADMDGMLVTLSDIFSGTQIGDVQFTRLSSNPASHEGGYLVVEVTANFIHPIPLPRN